MATKAEPAAKPATHSRPAETGQSCPQPLPRALPPEGSTENRGGYDCEFVEPPPSSFQSECPVCLLVLKEPSLISCCGHKFCRECIERIKKYKKPCALCNVPDFTFMRERALERSLKDMEVWCSYRKEGCEWKGKLGRVEEHLNRDSSPENQLNGCQFVAVECIQKCGEWYLRCHITIHQTQQCKRRPYSCQHCRDYQSTFEDVTEVHYAQCGKYPVACPNDCDVNMIKRQKLESHLREQCPLALVDYTFRFAGCETRLPRKDMPEHTKENIVHLTLLATATQKLFTENQKLVKENQVLQQRMIERDNTFHASLQKLNDSSSVKSFQEIVKKLQITENKVGALKEGVRKEMKQLVNYPGFPVDYYVKQTKKPVYLPAFYSHPHGYRMQLWVSPNGYGAGRGTHVSILTYILDGPFDDYLEWPFQGEVTIQIVNQVGDYDHVEEIIDFSDNTDDEDGWGYHEFLAHDRLEYNAARQTQYLKENTLHIRVMKVTV